VPLVLTFVAERYATRLVVPMIYRHLGRLPRFGAAAFYGPETKGSLLLPDLVVA
jgi:MFS transporter, SHS family, lactate transporter